MVDLEGLTVNDLLELCKKEVENGNGERKIMISCDDEGNDYHNLYYEFTPAEKLFVDEDGEYDEDDLPYGIKYDIKTKGRSLEDFIVFG